MKYLYILFFSTMGVCALQAQGEATSEKNCYQMWQDVFDARGAIDIVDGWYEDAIITIRTALKSDCFSGKVKVESGAVTQINLMYVNGKYDLFRPVYRSGADKGSPVLGGRTKNRETIEGEIITVFFPSLLKAKKPEFKRAPLPNPDDL
jgi:hypothetical protein